VPYIFFKSTNYWYLFQGISLEIMGQMQLDNLRKLNPSSDPVICYKESGESFFSEALTPELLTKIMGIDE
jgi:hypothetical protein